MIKLTPEQMGANFTIVQAEYDERILDEDKFAEAALIIGKWLAENFMKVGYKRMARLLVCEYKASLKEVKK
jgi:hypothetical protein